MYDIILGNLDRQARALKLLSSLLEEEFSLLVSRDTNAIMAQEFSIHELLRQLAVEKENTVRRLGGGKVRDYADLLEQSDAGESGEGPRKAAALRGLWEVIDELEQSCARQATRNTQLSLGLMDQSKELMDYLHKRLLPPQRQTYDRGVHTLRYGRTRPCSMPVCRASCSGAFRA